MDSFSRESLMSACGIDEAATRGRKRDSLFLLATIRVGTEAAVRDVRVRNLSEGGMMAELDRMVAIGTAVEVDLRGVGSVTGTIAWCAEHRIGISFDRSIDPRKARKPVGKGGTTPYYSKPAV